MKFLILTTTILASLASAKGAVCGTCTQSVCTGSNVLLTTPPVDCASDTAAGICTDTICCRTAHATKSCADADGDTSSATTAFVCGTGLTLKSNAATIMCYSDGTCDTDLCCDVSATCADVDGDGVGTAAFDCAASSEIAVTSAVTCAAFPCTAAECCTDPTCADVDGDGVGTAAFDDSGACAAASYGAALPATTVCTGGTCTADLCCTHPTCADISGDGDTTSDPFLVANCTASMAGLKAASASTLSCAAAVCTEDDCCEVSCAAHTCGTGYADKTDKATTPCTGGTCTDALCCDVDATCDDFDGADGGISAFTCAAGEENTGGTSACAAGVCTTAVCCSDVCTTNAASGSSDSISTDAASSLNTSVGVVLATAAVAAIMVA